MKVISLIITNMVLFASLIMPPFSNGSPLVEWDFDKPEETRGWGGEGIETAGSYQGIFRILGKEQFRLISPPNLGIPTREDPYLRIRCLFRSPRYLRVFWQPRSGKPVLVPEVIQPLFDRNFHTSWIPLTNKLEYRNTIEQLGLIFGGRPGWVEIDSIEILPFSLSRYLQDQWSEFLAPRRLHPGTINSLNSPRIFNKPFISWLNKLAVLILLIGVLLYYKASKGNRVKIATRIGMAILALWIIYDVRETYSQFKIVEEIHQTYVKPPPEEKTFPALGDFYCFVEFCRRYIPDDSVFELLPKPYWPFDCRLKYFLYPAHIESKKTKSFYQGRFSKYYITYNSPSFIVDKETGRIISADGKTFLSGPGRIIARYNKDSFIFQEEQHPSGYGMKR